MLLEGDLPEEYVTALPYLPGLQTPVKEQNTGDIYASNPVYGIIRARVEVERGEFYVCIGDSVRYQGGDSAESLVGRVVGLMLSEEVGGMSARVRRYMQADEILSMEPDFRTGVPSGVGGVGHWETTWLQVVPIENIVRIVKAGWSWSAWQGVHLRGTVSDQGEWESPYTNTLVEWEEPWMAVNGVRKGEEEEVQCHMTYWHRT